MKRLIGFGLLLALCSLPVLAAKNSQVFLLPAALRVGEATLPQGRCEVTWTDPVGSQVQLTIKTEDKKTVSVPAKVINEKQNNVGVATEVVNGVRYLTEFQTKNARLVIQGVPNDKK